MNELQDIAVRVTGVDGMHMEFTVPWDADLEAWEFKLKLIMDYLQFYVKEVVINPDLGDPEELDKIDDKEEDEFGNTKG